jgi:transcription elongation GreA/GreB family factor
VTESRIAELKTALESYQKLIANYTLTRDRLMDRRRGAADHVMVELDQRVEATQRTITALGRAVEITRSHLKLVEEGKL